MARKIPNGKDMRRAALFFDDCIRFFFIIMSSKRNSPHLPPNSLPGETGFLTAFLRQGALKAGVLAMFSGAHAIVNK